MHLARVTRDCCRTGHYCCHGSLRGFSLIELPLRSLEWTVIWLSDHDIQGTIPSANIQQQGISITLYCRGHILHRGYRQLIDRHDDITSPQAGRPGGAAALYVQNLYAYHMPGERMAVTDAAQQRTGHVLTQCSGSSAACQRIGKHCPKCPLFTLAYNRKIDTGTHTQQTDGNAQVAGTGHITPVEADNDVTAAQSGLVGG